MTRSSPRVRSIIAALALSAGLAAPALAQVTRLQDPERPDMPPARPMKHRLSPAFNLPTVIGPERVNFSSARQP